MGGAQTRNITDTTIESFINIANETVQKAVINANIIQIIDVGGVEGNVVITDTAQTATMVIELDAVFSAFTSTEAQQTLMREVTQEAVSALEGINVLQFVDAENRLESYMAAVMDISTRTEQLCDTDATIEQTVTVKQVGENVIIDNFNQVADMTVAMDCVADAVSNNKAVQDMQEMIDQSAEATAEGFHLWELALLALIGLLAILLPIVIPLAMGMNALMKIIYWILAAGFIGAGIAMVIIANEKRETKVWSTGYVLRGVEDFCGGVVVESDVSVATHTAAVTTVEARDDIDGYTFRALETGQDGLPVYVDGKGVPREGGPVVSYFRNFTSDTCPPLIESQTNQKTNADLWRRPEFAVGILTTEEPTPVMDDPREGDVFIDSSTMNYFIRTSTGGWTQYAPVDENGEPIVVGLDPTRRVVTSTLGTAYVDPGKYDYYINTDNPAELGVYESDGNNWSKLYVAKGAQWWPDICPSGQECIDWSGYKAKEAPNKWYQAFGWTGVGVGIILLAVAIFQEVKGAKGGFNANRKGANKTSEKS
uniref:Uncharacterized protein n=1 Tax=viral metagenome TaxID=1070528 RepID=A0A6C0BPJ4_9ZZZZ